MDTLLNIFLRGLAVGLFVSAPMGPVGILCIQRTLDKGRRTGFYTGVGAAASDFIYCLLTGLGLAFIEEFLERNQDVIQLIGSAVLIGFAIYLFKKNPSAGLRKPGVQPGSPGKDILGGFLFTFSNPLILFLIIGLFARFNFLSPDHKFYHYIAGYIAIVAGALGWWWLVTYFVDKLRAHFNVRSMWLINRCIGIVILIFALVGIISSVGSLTGWAANASAPTFSAGLFTSGQHRHVGVVNPDEIYFRVSSPSKEPGWSACISGPSSGVRMVVENIPAQDDSDPVFASRNGSKPRANVRLYAWPSDSLLISAELPKGISSGPGCNAWRFTRQGNEWSLWSGNREPNLIGSFALAPFDADTLSFYPLKGTKMSVSDVVVRGKSEIGDGIVPEPARDMRRGVVNLQADWGLYDYDIERSQIRLGGEYRLRLVEKDYGYDMLYVEGAKISPGFWSEGKLKGRLRFTPYPDVYDVDWLDHAGVPVTGGKGSVDDKSGYLTIQFPERSSSIRLRRID